MPRSPKKYNTDAFQRLDEFLNREFLKYMSYSHVPTLAARGIIRALLELVPIPNLNRRGAEGVLIGNLLTDNRALEAADKQTKASPSQIKSPGEYASGEQFMADFQAFKLGPVRVKHVLEFFSSHSIPRMQQQSDEILKALETTPRNNQKKTDWLNAILPELLQSFKSKHSCFTGCRANSTWPPMKKEGSGKQVIDTDTVKRIAGPGAGSGFASMKNEILAYYHGLSVSSVQHYLDGVKPKTGSRSARSRS